MEYKQSQIIFETTQQNTNLKSKKGKKNGEIESKQKQTIKQGFTLCLCFPYHFTPHKGEDNSGSEPAPYFRIADSVEFSKEIYPVEKLDRDKAVM